MKTNQPGQDLFKLIHSLNKAEAGYFVSYVNRSRIKNAEFYILFFKLVKKQEAYNEEALKKGLNDLGLVKNFALHKTRLADLVLGSVVAYKSSTSVDSQIQQGLESIKFLYEKQIYSHALKLVDKSKELARKYEKLSYLIELNNHQRMLLKNSAKTKVHEFIDENYRERQEISEKLENDSHLSYINDKVFAIYREFHHAKDQEKAKEVEKIMQNPLLSNENNALSFSAKLKFNYIHALYNQLLRKNKECFNYRKRQVELWDQNPHMKAEYPLRYHSDLNNLISISIAENKEMDFEDCIKQLERNAGNSAEIDAVLFSNIYLLRQNYLMNNRRFEQALQLIPKIEKGLKQFGNAIRPAQKLSLCYNIASTYFLNEKYAEALNAFESILITNRNHEVRTDLRDISGIFRIILLYQTGKHDLAEYEVRNTRDRLNYGNKLYELEQLVLENIPLLIKSNNQKAVLLTKLEELFNRSENKMLIGLEELIVWLRKK